MSVQGAGSVLLDNGPASAESKTPRFFFDLHVHSTYSSDSSLSPKVAITKARHLGLRGIAFTDHDRLTRITSTVPEFVLVPGVELSTDWGDLIALGISELPREGLSVPELIEKIHHQGGVAVVPHPFTNTPLPYAMNDRVYDIIDIVDGLEVTSPKSAVDNKKARKLVEDRAKAPVGGSDAHSPEMLGTGLTVCKDGSVDGLLRAIRGGITGAIIRK